MERGSGFRFGFFLSDLLGNNPGQLGRIDAVNPDRWAIDPIAAEGAGELLLTHFFVSHKAFAFGTDALPLNDLFTGIAGAHERPPFLFPESADPRANSSLFLPAKKMVPRGAQGPIWTASEFYLEEIFSTKFRISPPHSGELPPQGPGFLKALPKVTPQTSE